jgi:DnaJ-class molecular chaperone
MEWKWESVVDKKERAGGVSSEVQDETIAQSGKVKKTVELLRDEWYDCGFCSGTGEKPKGSTCPVCRGSKHIELTPPVVRCASCKGRGEEKPRSNVTCTPCRGKGYASVAEPVDVCPTCRGFGRTQGSSLACIRCKGIGVISVRK